VKIIEVFKSQTDDERRKNVTDAIVALENGDHHNHETYENTNDNKDII